MNDRGRFAPRRVCGHLDEAAGHRSCMCHESVEQRGIRGRRSVLLMAINEEDVIYILTKADVEDIAKDIGNASLIHQSGFRKLDVFMR